jgi:hypothetical protein
VRARWLSGRAISLHLALLLFVPGCALAAWWQITRAFDGNGLSYLYSVEWPIFAVVAVYFWWQLIHTDYETVGLKGMRRQQALEAAKQEAAAMPGGRADGAAGAAGVATKPPVQGAARAPVDVDDPELAAYNARLAELADKGPKTWRTRESVVVRRPQ